MNSTAPGPRSPGDFWGSLESVSAERDVENVAERVEDLRRTIRIDLADVEAVIRTVVRGPAEDGETPMQGCVRHLLGLPGKRLRPMCVALAARCGTGYSEAVRDLAASAELVHNSTLLHDDVVDLGERRRGAPTARVIFGNAASVYAGDWLLVEALERIQGAGIPGLMERMFEVLRAMLIGEALQLKNRGVLRGAMDDYFRVIDGKTSRLFRWALYAGARAGSLGAPECAALEEYGADLGLAFQIIDDVLDLSGDPAAFGKSMLTDLREGKMTYPLLLAAQRDPALAERLEHACRGAEIEIDPALVEHLDRALRDTGALADARALAEEHAARAVAHLAPLDDGPAKLALEGITVAVVNRRR